MRKSIFALSFLFAITLNAQDFQADLLACVDDCHLERYTGEQHLTLPITVPATVTVYLSRNLSIVTDHRITVAGFGGIQGGIAAKGAGLKVSPAKGFSDDAIVECTGPCVLDHLTIDGAAALNPQGQYIGLFLNRTYSGDHSQAVSFEVSNLQVQFVPVLQGIFVYSDPLTSTTPMGPDANQSCCGKFNNIRVVFNGGHGMLIQNTADVYCLQCEFNSNGGSGVMLLNSPTGRWVQSDFGGNNKGDGLTIGPGSCGQIITGVQFGGNKSPMHDYSGTCTVQHVMSATEQI